MSLDDIMTSLSDLDLAVPTRLTKQLNEAVDGDFEIIRLIARGAMGIVFLARDLHLDREVAIKVLLADAFTTKSEVERFKLEARTVAKLTHPNIVPVYSVREHEDLLLYIMQYVEGETLEEMIAHGPLDPEVVEAVVVMTAEGLAYAHEQSIVHRDVKPANVIVNKRGRAIIMDFGIAQLPENHGLTVAGSLVGTPNYASPEQCRAESANPASDQYSLGVVAYEMLTGRRLFESDSIAGIIQHHLNTSPPRILDVRPEAPAPLAHAIERMLEKTPEARWADLSELVAYLGGPRHTAPMAALTGSHSAQTGDAASAAALSGAELPPTQTAEVKPAARAPLSALLMIATAAVLIALSSTGLLSTLGFGPDGPPPGPPEEIAALPSTDGSTGQGGLPIGDSVPTGPLDDEAPDTGLSGADPMPVEVVTDPIDDPVDDPPATAEPPISRPTPATVTSTPPLDSPAIVDDRPATLLLGTRGLAAVLFVDDVPMGAASRLRSWTIEAGRHELSLRVEGCPTWDSTVVALPGDEMRLGYRLPDCGRQEKHR